MSMMWDREIFFEKLYMVLKEKNWSLCELSIQAGLSTGMIYRWRNKGVIPSMESLQKISNALQIPLEYLLCSDKKSGRENKVDLICSLARELSESQLDAIICMEKTLIGKGNSVE